MIIFLKGENMNKKLLVVGLSSALLLASCSGSASAVGKKVNFKEIVSKNNEIELLGSQVLEGLLNVNSLKIKRTAKDYFFNSKDVKEQSVEEVTQSIQFFTNGYVNSASAKVEENGSTFENVSFTYKEAVTEDAFYFLNESSKQIIPSYGRKMIEKESGESKETILNGYHRELGEKVLPLDVLFGHSSDTYAFDYDRSVVGRFSDKKIGAYYEYKYTHVFNTEIPNSESHTQVESGYTYMEAELVGDVYQICKLERKDQIVGNYYDGSSSSRDRGGLIILDKYEVLSEIDTSYEIKYNKKSSDLTESSELSDLVSKFPTWFISKASIKAKAYTPVIDPETKKVVDVESARSLTVNPLHVSSDLHSFDTSMTNADANYFFQFTINAEIVAFDAEGNQKRYSFSHVVDLDNGSSYGETVVNEAKYYKGTANKLYNFSVKLSFDATAEAGKELSVAEFKVA